MKRFSKIIASILCLITISSVFSSCSKATQATTEATVIKKDNFRITAYIVGDNCVDLDNFDSSNISKLTDIILFGVANFDENGNVVLSDNFEVVLNNIKSLMNESQNIYLNILGPTSEIDSDDWYKQMADQAKHHNKAFKSGNLEQNIKTTLEKYNFDGVFFDYEFPIKKKDWKPYNEFIVTLDSVLGDEYKIGMSMVEWNLKQSKEAMQATDLITVMSYDNWDDNNYHSTVELAKSDIKKFVKAGYDKSKIDLGVPFYARPTTQEAYWYEYKAYYDKLDENGLYYDNDTELTFSFNTYDMIKEKTEFAISEGLGGIMVWHYSCDLPADNEKSLFNAIENGIDDGFEK